MTTPTATSTSTALVRAGVLTALSDGLFACALNVFVFGSTIARLWQGVAATVLGPPAFEGGAATALLGVAMHVCVAFTWSLVFLILARTMPAIRAALRSRHGTALVCAIYGPCIWIVMTFVVIPLLTGRPPAITYRWWIQFVGHAVFVAVPIVTSIAPAVVPRRALD